MHPVICPKLYPNNWKNTPQTPTYFLGHTGQCVLNSIEHILDAIKRDIRDSVTSALNLRQILEIIQLPFMGKIS